MSTEAFVVGRPFRPKNAARTKPSRSLHRTCRWTSRGSVVRNFCALFSRRPGLAAILVLPGALIGAPFLWWLGNRRKKSPQPMWKECLLTQRCQQPRRKLDTHRKDLNSMRNTLKTAALVLALAAPATPAEELAPDATRQDHLDGRARRDPPG